MTLVLLQLAMRLVVISGFGINLMQLPGEDKSQVACTLALLRKYFDYSDALSGSVLCVSITPYNRDVQERLLHGLNQHEDFPWTLLTTRPQEKDKGKSQLELKLLHEKPQCYFLVVGDLEEEDLQETFAHWKRMLNWNPFAQFVVYLAAVEETDEDMTDLMVELLLTFMNNKLYNVNVIGQSEENEFYYAKTSFPYHPDNNCGNRVIAIDLLDACSYEENEQEGEEEEEEENYNKTDIPMERCFNPENTLENNSSNQNLAAVEIEEYIRARFEDKFPHDLSGCPIRAAYRGSWEPYIFTISSDTDSESYHEPSTDETPNESASQYDDSYIDVEEYHNVEHVDSNNGQVDEPIGQAKLTGLEYQLLETIAQRLHVTIEFTMQSSNVFHLFQQLIEGKIDVIVGGIDEDPSISQVVSSSTSYHQDELAWCVARAKRKHSFFNFLAGFNTYAWCLLLIFIISSSLAVLAAQKVSGFRLNSLPNFFSISIRMLGILLTQAINVDAQAMPLVLRMLFALAFYMAFFFSNTYQSFLITTLTTPTTQTQISHLEEIYGNRMTILVSSEHVRHLDKEGETFKYIREKFQICYNIVDCLNEAADNEHIAVAVSRQHAFYNARIQRDKLYCFDRRESLYVYPVAMLLPKKFQLLQQINGIIQNVIESGHMQKWARDLDMVRLIHEKIARAQEDDFKSLNLSQFHGAFAFASALLLLASGVFALESLVYWSVIKRRTRLRPLRWCHRRFR
ncbi:uncharacterized protein LOC117789533 [Drosophila innubila]|uniref:uncharacterized protein LOC117789533 n=1 Tax=Drosophila innubila TaxID=198719 RepID=UPI00148CA5F9|nr:uncharacterized protein LOC117789533 [Drosophila innubila]